jgi:hypothetical protein
MYPEIKTDTKEMEVEEENAQSVRKWLSREKALANSEVPAGEVEGRGGGGRQRESSVDGRAADSLWDRSFSPLFDTLSHTWYTHAWYTHTHGTHSLTHKLRTHMFGADVKWPQMLTPLHTPMHTLIRTRTYAHKYTHTQDNEPVASRARK